MRLLLPILFTWLLTYCSGIIATQRIQDITDIAGVRSNQLIGYGLVVGLDGSGDNAEFTNQSLKNMLSRLGIMLPAGTSPKSKNIAAVMVTATLPAFAKQGQTIDITVSTLGSAKSLRGGTLIITPLKGVNGKIYAIAQGSLVVGGFSAGGNSGSTVVKNIPSSGRIPDGATVEKTVKTPFALGNNLVLYLNRADFTTAHRIANTINQFIGTAVANPIDAASVEVSVPTDRSRRVEYISALNSLVVTEGVADAKIVINARTGTIVINQNVQVTPAAVSIGDLIVSITEDPEVSQPNAFSEGQTTVVNRTAIDVTEQKGRMFLMKSGQNLKDIVKAVNEVGATTQDLISILEALKQAGALHAKLVII